MRVILYDGIRDVWNKRHLFKNSFFDLYMRILCPMIRKIIYQNEQNMPKPYFKFVEIINVDISVTMTQFEWIWKMVLADVIIVFSEPFFLYICILLNTRQWNHMNIEVMHISKPAMASKAQKWCLFKYKNNIGSMLTLLGHLVSFLH